MIITLIMYVTYLPLTAHISSILCRYMELHNTKCIYRTCIYAKLKKNFKPMKKYIQPPPFPPCSHHCQAMSHVT